MTRLVGAKRGREEIKYHVSYSVYERPTYKRMASWVGRKLKAMGGGAVVVYISTWLFI